MIKANSTKNQKSPGGMYSPFEPSQWELDMAVHNINTATTEVGAVKAAAGVHRIGLDLADVVVNALEEKIARLRNPTWMRPRPPPIPRGLNVLRMVRMAYHEIQQAKQAKAAADAARAAADSARAAAKSAKANQPPPPTPGAPQPPPPPQQAPMPRPPPPPGPKPLPTGPKNPPPPSPQTQQGQHGKQDFMSDFIQQRRQQRGPPPPAPKLFNNVRPTNPPYVKQTAPKPADPYQNQPLFRPLPSQDAFKPPPNVPTPPKINWNTKPPTSNEKALPQSAPEPSNGRFSSSYDPPSALPDMNSPKKSEPKYKPMKIPKANLPPPPKRTEPRGPMNLFPKRNTKRPSDIPKAVLSSDKTFKRESKIMQTKPTTPPPNPQEKEMFNRYPGLFENKAKERAAHRRKQKLVSRRKSAAKSNSKAIGNASQIKLSVPYQTVQSPPVQKQTAVKVKTKSIKPSKIWSPLGNLGSNINEILKFSIGGPSDSVPIPRKNPPKPTTTKPTVAKRPSRPKPKQKRRVKKTRKQVIKKTVAVKANPKSISIAVSTRVQKPKKEPKKGGNDTLKQLELLLKGITPSQLQTLVDLIQAKSNEGKPKPTPKPIAEVQAKQLYIPPPPGSQNRGPSREMRGNNQGIPLGGQQRNNPMPGPNMDYGQQNNMRGGPPPQWNRGGPNGPMGPGPMGRGPMGGPMGPQGGPKNGPFGGLDMNNPQVARLIRVLSGRSQGGAAAAGGEAPEAGEGPTNLLGNPLMMGMLMNNQGGQGGGLASLLGGGGGGAGNPIAALLAGGGGAGGGGKMDIMTLMGGNGVNGGQNAPPAGNPLAMLGGLRGLSGTGNTGPRTEGGMNPALLAMMQGGGAGGGGGINGLARMLSGGPSGRGGGLGNLGALGAAMMNPDGPGGPEMTALLTAAASGQTPGGASSSGSQQIVNYDKQPAKSSAAKSAIKPLPTSVENLSRKPSDAKTMQMELFKRLNSVKKITSPSKDVLNRNQKKRVIDNKLKVKQTKDTKPVKVNIPKRMSDVNRQVSKAIKKNTKVPGQNRLKIQRPKPNGKVVPIKMPVVPFRPKPDGNKRHNFNFRNQNRIKQGNKRLPLQPKKPIKRPTGNQPKPNSNAGSPDMVQKLLGGGMPKYPQNKKPIRRPTGNQPKPNNNAASPDMLKMLLGGGMPNSQQNKKPFQLPTGNQPKPNNNAGSQDMLQMFLGGGMQGGGTPGGMPDISALLGGGGLPNMGSLPGQGGTGAGTGAGGLGGLGALLGGGGSGGMDGLGSLLMGGGAGGFPGAAGGLSGLAGRPGAKRPGSPGLGIGAGLGGPGGLAHLMNPMGPGRPLIRGMDANQVSDLMGGKPGPVPMDIAIQADTMSKMGHTVDHIVDVLGDVLQARRRNPLAAMAAASAMASGMGGMGGMGTGGFPMTRRQNTL